MNKKHALSLPALLVNSALILALAISMSGAAARAAPGALPPEQPDAPAAFGRHTAAGGDFLVSTPGDLNPVTVAIAYNPDDDQFLIAAATHQGILAQIYGSDGVPEENTILISLTPVAENPDLAYSTTRQEYLLVWDQDFAGNRFILGQRLSRSGALLDNPDSAADESDPGVNFQISNNPSYKADPAIAYNGLDDEYLVAWYQDGDIFGQRVDGDGYLLDNPNTVPNEHFMGESFPISEANSAQETPDVIYDPDDSEYLVVWQDQRDLTHYGIFGQRVDANGDLLDNPASPEVETTSSVNFLIHRLAAYDAHTPAGAYNTHLHQYLVVWSQLSGTSTTIAGDRVTRLGALIDDPNTGGDESLTNISSGSLPLIGESLTPALVYNPEHQEYLLALTFSELLNDAANRRIFAARLEESGRVRAPYDFAVSTSLSAGPPALAYGPATGQYLIAWPHFDAALGSTDRVLAQRVWWPSLLLGHEFNALPALDDQKSPAVAYNSRDLESLVVWEDWRDGNANIYGQRYDREGLPIGDNFQITSRTDDDLDPSVAYSPYENEYLVVWEGGGQRYLRYAEVTAHGTFDTGIRNFDHYATGVVQNPTVEYISQPGEQSYMIAYRRVNSPTDSDIASRRVLPDYTYQDCILEDGEKADYPDLAYNATANQLLLAFTDDTQAVGEDVSWVVIEPDCTLVSPVYVFPMAEAQSHPSVTWNQDDNQYFMAWHDYRNSGVDGSDIYGLRLAATGDGAGANFKISKMTGPSFQQYPQVTYAPDLDAYRVVWQDDRNGGDWDIRGNWVSSAGAVLHNVDDPLFTYPGWQMHPALLYIPAYQQALVAWQDGRSASEYDIYATFGAVDLTPPTARFTRDPIWGRVGDTFTFNAWPSRDETTPRGSLQVRWDLNNDGAWDIPLGRDKYITQTVMTTGIYTITLEVWDRAFNTDQIKQRIFVAPAPVPLLNLPFAPLPPPPQPPTATFTVTPTLAVAGTLFTFDGRASQGSHALQARWDWENDGLFDTGFTTVMTATHVYTTSGDHTARLEVMDQVESLSRAAIRNVHVLPGPVVSLEILPGDAALIPDESLLWRYIAVDSFGNPIFGPPLIWSVLDPQAGQISASGVFTASGKYGQYPSVIRIQSGIVNDTSSVLIYPPYQTTLPLILR